MLDGVEAGCGAEVGKSKKSVVESEESGCKMSKKMQARVMEACVESGLLFEDREKGAGENWSCDEDE